VNQLKKEYKKIIIISLAAAAVMFILILLNNINFNVDMSGWFGGRKSEETEKIHLVIPDYKSDIYQNDAYMSKNRYITFIDEPFTAVITETNNDYGNIGQFFLDYFKALTDGNAGTYNSFFTDIYFEDKNNTEYKKFTMQKIYDAEVEKLSESLINDESEYSGWTRYTFRISYKIMANDGTFRSDMPSDTAVPQILELLYDGETYKINSIIKTKTAADQ
jgi:hypothetical protein